MSNVELDFDALASGDELSLEDILAIEQAGSEKGIYQRDLLDFLNSGKLGAPYRFTGKAAQSVKMGFTSAIKAIKENADLDSETKAAAAAVEVRVRKGDKTKDEAGNDVAPKEFVFLINQYAVQKARGGAPVGSNGNTETAQSEQPATV